MLDPQLNCLPQKIESIHVMGICGTGMAALAVMLKQSGYVISGSDRQVYPPMSTYLAQQNIHPFDGYAAENLDHDPDLVIVGNVITRNNPEALALAASRRHYLSFPQALAEFFIRSRQSIVVAGTHGKTTTCSLLASSLFHAGLDPTFMIGGIVAEFNSNNRIGNGPYFVAEGDEYDTAFFDKESKFLHYRPKIAVITSIEFDHADIFADLDQIKRSFRKFVGLLPADGLIIAHLDDANVAEVVGDAPCAVQGYGYHAANDWILSAPEAAHDQTVFGLSHAGEQHRLAIPLTGRHNCLNAVAVTAVLRHLGLPFATIQACLAKFRGVKRRQEVRGRIDGITVIDDFAHHPTAVKQTLDGLKAAHPRNRLVAVFEPRTNSSRRAIFQKDYATAFGAADLVVLREPVPLANVATEEQFSSARLADDIRPANASVWAFADTEAILDHLEAVLEDGDQVVILSNGGFDNIHERLLEMLKMREGRKLSVR